MFFEIINITVWLISTCQINFKSGICYLFRTLKKDERWNCWFWTHNILPSQKILNCIGKTIYYEFIMPWSWCLYCCLNQRNSYMARNFLTFIQSLFNNIAILRIGTLLFIKMKLINWNIFAWKVFSKLIANCSFSWVWMADNKNNIYFWFGLLDKLFHFNYNKL